MRGPSLLIAITLLATACSYDTKPIYRPTVLSQPQLPNVPPAPNPPVIPPPPPIPTPPINPARSQLSPLNCPWGAEASREVRTLRDTGVDVKFGCDHVLYQEALYGTDRPNFPTFDDVKRSYDSWIAAIGEDPTLPQTFARNGRIRRVLFVTKQGANELSFEHGTLYLSLYGLNDPRAVMGTIRGILAYGDSEYEGLPVLAKNYKTAITGAARERSDVMDALAAFEPAFRLQREQLLQARSAIRSIEVERPHGSGHVPLFRGTVLSIPQRGLTNIEWTLEDALAVAKAFSQLPEPFRNRVQVTVSGLPDSDVVLRNRPELAHARAIDLIRENLDLLQTLAPNLLRLELGICSELPIIGNEANCTKLNDQRTEMKLHLFNFNDAGGRSVETVSSRSVSNQIRKLFGLAR